MSKLEIHLPKKFHLEAIEDLIIHLLFSEGLDNISSTEETVYTKNKDGIVLGESQKVYTCDCDIKDSHLEAELKRIVPDSNIVYR